MDKPDGRLIEARNRLALEHVLACFDQRPGFLSGVLQQGDE
jgi:hypothetical protein